MAAENSNMDPALLEKILKNLDADKRVEYAGLFSDDAILFQYYDMWLKKTAPENAGENLAYNFDSYTPPHSKVNELVLYYLNKNNINHTDFYETIGMSNSSFSRFKDNNTAVDREYYIKMCFVFKLDYFESVNLLSMAKVRLSQNNKRDCILSSCLYRGIYDTFKVDEVLEDNELEPLFSEE